VDRDRRQFSVFYAYRDSPARRAALSASAPTAMRYSLFGLDQHLERGVRARHNLELTGRPPAWARRADHLVNVVVSRTGGYSGDFASILASLSTANRADVVLSTVDTVGLPLVLLKRAGLLRRPLVYVAVGLPERLAQLRNRRIRGLYVNAFRRVDTILAYSVAEAEHLTAWLGGDSQPRVRFVPFGVDVNYFAPDGRSEPSLDAVSVGADPHRDFGLLLQVAARRPEWRIGIVATAERALTLGTLPPNVSLESDVPFPEIRERLARARLVVLPVRDNSYSGATTVLLQAMAMGKPVVVSRTRAIADGYGLVDGENCVLVPPGDAAGFERSIEALLADEGRAAAIGARARETAKRELSWTRYTDAVWDVLADVVRRHSGP